MKDYHFQYTKMGVTILVTLLSMAMFAAAIWIGLYLAWNAIVSMTVALVLAIIIFRVIRRFAVFQGDAAINDDCVSFNFANESRHFNYGDILFYKIDIGRTLMALTLKTANDDFRMTSNNNFCNTDDFVVFTKNLTEKLEECRSQNPNIGSLNQEISKKRMLGGLIALSILVALLCFVLDGSARIAVICMLVPTVGLCWWLYFRRNDTSN